MLNKGFLGPIGDDLPSLIPLLFALLIFFSTFTFSYSVFSQKNAGFEKDIDILNIARVLKGTNYIAGHSDFMESCASLNPTNLKYRAVVTNYFTAPVQYCKTHSCPSEFCANFCSDTQNALECSLAGNNVCPAGEEQNFKAFMINAFETANSSGAIVPFNCESAGNSADLETFLSKNVFVSKIYPVVIEDDRVVKPMHLVVIAWTQ